MQSGKLDKRIDLEAKSRTPDGMGGYSDVWQSVESSIWAAIWPVSVNEQIKSGQPKMVITHRIRIRYRRNVRPDWRIKYKDEYYSIEGIINFNMAYEYLDLLAKEVV